MSANGDSGKLYHTKCTGDAAVTAEAHTADAPFTLFGSCFCPFVQRAWVAFEYLGIPYKYYEINPYQSPKPQELLEISPKGLVPALKLNEYSPPRALNESTIIVEFLEDLATQSGKEHTLLPPVSEPYARALIRLQSDHIGRTLVPSFYRYLQAQDPEKQVAGGREFHQAIETLVGLFERATAELGNDPKLKKHLGLYAGGELGLADVLVAPWIFRATNTLKHYRGFELPKGNKFSAWVQRLFDHPAFKATCSTEQLYLDSYERYAYNRPNTSQVADAINSGRALP
ncbi:glutathione S-transferase [Amanita rubescens]|nr:glutathione S-transferase [Amanita rubescens]